MDEVDLEKLVQSLLPRLRSHIERSYSPSLKNKLSVDDIVQETVLRALARLSDFQFRGEASLFCWLKVIADNYARNKIRRSKDSSGLESGIAESIVDSGLLRPSETARRKELMFLVNNVILELPSKYQKILHMRLSTGATFETIASKMSMTTGAVTGLYRNALVAIRRQFADVDDTA